MSEPRRYKTAAAFRRALEERLKKISAAEEIDLNRLRRQASFDRLLARLFRARPAPWLSKAATPLSFASSLRVRRSTLT